MFYLTFVAAAVLASRMWGMKVGMTCVHQLQYGYDFSSLLMMLLGMIEVFKSKAALCWLYVIFNFDIISVHSQVYLWRNPTCVYIWLFSWLVTGHCYYLLFFFIPCLFLLLLFGLFYLMETRSIVKVYIFIVFYYLLLDWTIPSWN